MKMTGFQKTGFTLGTATLLALSMGNVFAQDSTPPTSDLTTPNETPPATQTATAPVLSPADQQILQLAQAKISDGTIITYIQNSGTIYGLNASQIVYLKQQGVSESVINAMLNQRSALAAAPAQPQPQNNPQTPPPSATVEQPATPAPAPSSNVYVVPDSQTYYYDQWASPYIYPYYYPYYGVYAPVGVYWGWGGGWHGGFHGGGFHGGFHR